MTGRKTIRLLGVSLALLALLVFATGVVSDWNHQSPSDDANCPYCHSRPSNPGRVRSRAVGFVAEADRFLAAAGRHCAGNVPRLFPDRTSRTPCLKHLLAGFIHRFMAPRRVARTT